MFEGNTTWTVGRVLSSLIDSDSQVVIYAGPHIHQGSVRGVGEHLVTLSSGEDLIAVSLPEVTSFHVLGGARTAGDEEWTEEVPAPRDEVLGSSPAGPTWFQPPPLTADELAAREREEQAARVEGWTREIIHEAGRRSS